MQLIVCVLTGWVSGLVREEDHPCVSYIIQ